MARRKPAVKKTADAVQPEIKVEVKLTPTEEFVKNLDEKMLPIYEQVATFVRNYSGQEVEKVLVEKNQKIEQLEKYYKLASSEKEHYCNKYYDLVSKHNKLDTSYNNASKVALGFLVTTLGFGIWTIISIVLLCL